MWVNFGVHRSFVAKLLVAIALFFTWAGTALAQIAPAIWKMQDEDTTIYITGTIHLMTPETQWFNDELRKRFDAADNLVLEYNMQDETTAKVGALMQQAGMLPADDSLKNYFAPNDFEKLLELNAESPPGLQVSAAVFERFRPWLAMLRLATGTAIANGFLPQYGVDLTLMTLAGQSGKTIMGLETAEFQVRLFADLPDKEAAALVEAGLPQLENLKGTFTAMRDNWLAGNMDKLAEIINEGFSEDDSALEAFLWQRNRHWRDELIKALDEPGTFFVAVGAGHLAGKQNLIDLIREAGVKVVRE